MSLTSGTLGMSSSRKASSKTRGRTRRQAEKVVAHDDTDQSDTSEQEEDTRSSRQQSQTPRKQRGTTTLTKTPTNKTGQSPINRAQQFVSNVLHNILDHSPDKANQKGSGRDKGSPGRRRGSRQEQEDDDQETEHDLRSSRVNVSRSREPSARRKIVDYIESLEGEEMYPLFLRAMSLITLVLMAGPLLSYIFETLPKRYPYFSTPRLITQGLYGMFHNIPCHIPFWSFTHTQTSHVASFSLVPSFLPPSLPLSFLSLRLSHLHLFTNPLFLYPYRLLYHGRTR